MFGAVIGVLSLVGLYKLWGGRYGPRFGLRGLYRALDTTVGQEKVLSDSVETLREHGRALRTAALDGREVLSRSLRNELVDVNGLRESFEAQKAALSEAQAAVLDALQKTHAVLDAEQRARLARMVEGRFFHSSAHRCHSHHASWRRGPAFI